MYYKVEFSGFYVVRAESEEEAKEICEEDFIYRILNYDNVSECKSDEEGKIPVLF